MDLDFGFAGQLRANCYHDRGHDADCRFNESMFMIMFGLVQVVVSQIPNFHDMAWLSILAAIMSFCYASIGFILGFAKVVGTIYDFAWDFEKKVRFSCCDLSEINCRFLSENRGD